MHVAVLGAGVVGVTAAHYLIEAGHSVTVIDREAEVAKATSFANAAQLCYSFSDALATPRFIGKIPGLILGTDHSIQIRPEFDTEIVRWGTSFLRQCTSARAQDNTIKTLQMARRSSLLLADLRARVPVEFSFRRAGKLVMLSSESEIANAIQGSELKARHGCQADVITVDEAIDIEPAIKHMTGKYSGAVYSPDDEVGDAHAFTVSLAAELRKSSECAFQLGTSIMGIVLEKNRVRAIETDQGSIAVDAAVVALGVWSPRLLKPLGIDPGIYPARGYSLTLPPGQHAPSVSVTDQGRRFVVSRIGEQIRVAGFADFVGFRTANDSRRTRELLELARRYAPVAADYAVQANNAWGGFRPLTVTGRPLVGGTPVDGLYLNTGHGMLGWTLACVSGHDIAEIVTRKRAPQESLTA